MNHLPRNSMNGGYQNGGQMNYSTRNIEQSNGNPMQACVRCYKPSLLVCDRCGDYYCSIDCQRLDWNRHRSVCFKMPHLVPAVVFPTNLASYPQLNDIRETGNGAVPIMNGNHNGVINNPIPMRTNEIKCELPTNSSLEMQQSIKPQPHNSVPTTTPTITFPPTPPAPVAEAVDGPTETIRSVIQKNQSSPLKPVEKNSIAESMTTSPEIPKSGSDVMLTGFRSSNRCCIRSILPQDDKDYIKIIKTVNEYGITAPKMINMPRPGDYAITTFGADALFYRVEIINVRNNIHVYYVDYGNTASKKLSELRKCSDDIKNLKKYAFPIILKDVPFYNFDERLTTFLEKFENLNYRLEYTKKDDRSFAEGYLKDLSTNEAINDEINKFAKKEGIMVKTFDKDSDRGDDDNNKKSQKPNNENRESVSDRLERLRSGGGGGGKQQQQNNRPQQQNQRQQQQPYDQQSKEEYRARKPIEQDVTPSETIKSSAHSRQSTPLKQGEKSSVAESSQLPLGNPNPVLKPPFETVVFKAGTENLSTFIVDNSDLHIGGIGVLAISDLNSFKQAQAYLAKYKDTERPYRPVLHEYCLAKFEGDWYRAKVINCSADLSKFSVTYIDYTNEGEVTPKEIRRYPDDLDVPCCSNLCIIEGLPDELNPKQLEFLQSKLPAYGTLKIDKVTTTDVDGALMIKVDSVINELRANSLL